MLVWYCTAVALKRHERVNAFGTFCPPGGIVITVFVCWLVRSLVHDACRDFSNCTGLISMKFGTDFERLLTFERSRVKVYTVSQKIPLGFCGIFLKVVGNC